MNTLTIIIISALAIIAAAGGIGWHILKREHTEARSLPLDTVDFSRLQDGTYHGAYAGGMYQWRANACKVTVQEGHVTDIQPTEDREPGEENADARMLYDRVIQAQSLQVDTISGATLTSKAYLQGVENALRKAQTDA
jgi:uncharacterized protein with FMN-binding domain